jgi:hypothetical protein
MDGQKPNTPEDDFQAASKATAEDDYENYTNHGSTYSAPKHRLRKLGIVLAVLLVLAAIGFGVYWMFLRDDGKADDSSQNANDLPATSQVEEQQPTISEETEHYASQGFMLEFDYPSDWTVQEESGGGVLTAISPNLQLKSAEGKPITAKVVFTIRNKQQPMPEFDNGNSVAVRESEKIDYTKPSSVQRGSTYLSFLRYATTQSPNGLDGIYVTGDVGYQKNQAIPKADFVPVDPVISVTIRKCADSACKNGGTQTPLDAAMWDDKSFADPIRKMLQSLVVN